MQKAYELFITNKREAQIRQISECLMIKENIKRDFDEETAKIDKRIADIEAGNLVKQGERY